MTLRRHPAQLPAGSYVRPSWTPESFRPSSWSYTDRADHSHGVILRCTRDPEVDPDGIMHALVVHPKGGKTQSHVEMYRTSIRVICEAPTVELVEFPHGDAKALRELKKRIDKSLKDITRARAYGTRVY